MAADKCKAFVSLGVVQSMYASQTLCHYAQLCQLRLCLDFHTWLHGLAWGNVIGQAGS